MWRTVKRVVYCGGALLKRAVHCGCALLKRAVHCGGALLKKAVHCGGALLKELFTVVVHRFEFQVINKTFSSYDFYKN